MQLAERLRGDRRFGQPNLIVGLKSVEFSVPAGGEVVHRYSLYVGPLREEELAKTKNGEHSDYGGLITYGWSWFDWLSKLLRLVLLAVGRGVNYGWAIVILTALVKLALHPLSRKSMASMHRMQKLQPEIAALKKKYERDKSPEAQRKMLREQQDLFRAQGVSPMGGCLPMLVQIPMLIALFGTFRASFELRQAPFIWISDLSRPDELFLISSTGLPFVGWTHFNLLPVLYILLSFVQMKLSPKPADPEQAQQQRMMAVMMPVMMFIFFYTMPSGLVLYFAASNVFGILEQWYVRRGLLAAEAAGSEDDPPSPASPALRAPQEQRSKKKNRRK
jgi:YidC/Oxa1 family membrane protein insertase